MVIFRNSQGLYLYKRLSKASRTNAFSCTT